MSKIEQAQRYLRRIRNVRKWEYAKALTCWHNSAKAASEPRPVQLSYMAAQAVRLKLAEIFEPTRGQAMSEEEMEAENALLKAQQS